MVIGKGYGQTTAVVMWAEEWLIVTPTSSSIRSQAQSLDYVHTQAHMRQARAHACEKSLFASVTCASVPPATQGCSHDARVRRYPGGNINQGKLSCARNYDAMFWSRGYCFVLFYSRASLPLIYHYGSVVKSERSSQLLIRLSWFTRDDYLP